MSATTFKPYATTLGELLCALAVLDPDTPMKRLRPHSYRGYYECLGLTETDELTDVQAVHARLSRAVGEEFTAYKGGEYVMEMSTTVYAAEWGCTGHPVTGVNVGANGACLSLGTDA